MKDHLVCGHCKAVIIGHECCACIPLMLKALESARDLFKKGHALDNFNWAASALRAQDIKELNELPLILAAAIKRVKEGG